MIGDCLLGHVTGRKEGWGGWGREVGYARTIAIGPWALIRDPKWKGPVQCGRGRSFHRNTLIIHLHFNFLR